MTTDLFGGAASPAPAFLPHLPGFHAEWDEDAGGHRINVPDGELFFAEHFFPGPTADRTVEYFQEHSAGDWRQTDWRAAGDPAGLGFLNIPWTQDHIQMFGKRRALPRWTSWHGDPGRSYTYSGIAQEPNPWNKGLLHLKTRIEAAAGTRFNSALLNWYRDGGDTLGWHSDDEPELGADPVIASASFGAARDFLLRRKDDPEVRLSIPLTHGALLIMSGALQTHWEHSVPKRARVKESRFNVTFRRVG